jgi:plastocyanin
MDDIQRSPTMPGDPTRPTRVRAVRLLVASVVVLSLIGGVRAPVRALPPTSVDIQDSRYLPPTLTVAPGSTVRWTNRDEETHTVTSATGLFGSAGLDLDEAYTYTFNTPGVYPYTCDLHPFMQGTIVVR